MKVTCIPDKVSDEVSDGKFTTRLISSIEENERALSLDALAMAEFVKQRRRDALRITELTLRAIEVLKNPDNNSNTFCKKSAVNGVRD
jgi:hypothetical protein